VFSALSVSLPFTTLARAVPYDCFDGERRRAPISVSGCNYSLEGPHLAVGSRQPYRGKRESKKWKVEDMKKQKMRQKRWGKTVKHLKKKTVGPKV